MRTILIHPEAADEAERATAWYEKERPGLGADFEAAIDAALDLLGEDLVPSLPMPGIPKKHGVRRLILKRFPYDVVFVDYPEHVWVIAFAHHARRPGFWRGRLRT